MPLNLYIHLKEFDIPSLLKIFVKKIQVSQCLNKRKYCCIHFTLVDKPLNNFY